MSDQDFERVFRIYLNNKESEAFTLKFYKDTSKEDMSIIIKETISNLKHFYKNSNLKTWQDSQQIDVDYDLDLVRFRDSLFLSETLPYTEANTRPGTRINTQEDKDSKIEGFLSPESNRLTYKPRNSEKFEVLDFDKEDSKGSNHLMSNPTPHNIRGSIRQSFDLKSSNRAETENNSNRGSQRNSNDPLKSLITSNRFSDLSITFNPNKNQSFFIDFQRNSNPENFSLYHAGENSKVEDTKDVKEPKDTRVSNHFSIPEHKSIFAIEKANSIAESKERP